MKIDWFVKTLLFTVAVFLGILALRPVLFPPAVSAQGPEVYPFYIEPGVVMLRARREPPGVWPHGRRSPQRQSVGISDYDSGHLSHERDEQYSPTSRPFLLAKFAFSDTDK
jgi:hypothetical protein